MPLNSMYAAFFLSRESRKLLLEKVPPKYPKVYADHLTIGFGKDMRPYYPIGARTTITAWFSFLDEKCQAVFCSTDLNHLLPISQIPHITISCNEVPPSYSSDLIRKTPGTLIERIELVGDLDYFPRTF